MAYIKRGHPNRRADPAREQIEAATAQIREAWSPLDYLIRAGLARDKPEAAERLRYCFPVVHSADLAAAAQYSVPQDAA